MNEQKGDALRPIEIGKSAAVESGLWIKEQFFCKNIQNITKKAKNDFVTYVDVESERKIKKEILAYYPDHEVLGEEEGLAGSGKSYRWIVDPLDGTANFIQKIPHFSISIALLQEQEPIAAVVYNPITEELFTAEKGQGAFLNDEKISVSQVHDLSDSFAATGFPFKSQNLTENYSNTFKHLFQSIKGMRRCGSAALDLAYLAAGRYDFFWEALLMPWDYAAGSLLITESGGKITDFNGNQLNWNSSSVLASNRKLYEPVKNIINRFF